MAKPILLHPSKRRPRLSPRRPSVSRRANPERWDVERCWQDLESLAQAAKLPRRTFCKDHLVYLPQGAVIASRRALAARWHRSAAGVQKILSQWEREGRGKLVIGKCGRLCRGKRHEHVSIFIVHRHAASACQEIITRAIRNLSVRRETYTHKNDGAQHDLQLLFRRKGLREGPYDDSALDRLTCRVPVEQITRGLSRISYSRFLRGKKPGRRGTVWTGLTVAWAADHFEQIAGGRYDDRGKFGSPPPEGRPLLFPDGSPVTVGRLEEYQALLRRRAA